MKRLPRGELETRVMHVLWQHGDWLTPGDVHNALPGGRDLAYTTVETVLGRLYTKEQLERRREGRAFAYRPIMTRDEWAAQRMREVLDAAGDRDAALAHFVDGIDRGSKVQLRRALGQRRRR